jgi:hypothetical protein
VRVPNLAALPKRPEPSVKKAEPKKVARVRKVARR